MPTRSQFIAQIKDDYGDAWTELDDLEIFLTNGYIEWVENRDHNAINYLYAVVARLRDSLYEVVGKGYPLSSQYAVPEFLEDHTISEGGVDMPGILAAMMQSSNDEYKQFIGIVDAYRMALWNQPFNVEFYAALARGFANWE